jgi:hypothetical protein
MPRKPALPPIYPDSVTVPPTLPEAAALAQCGLPLSREEFDYVRAAMGLMAVARQPKLTWNGWKLVGGALALAERYAVALAKNTSGPAYNRHIGPFLRASGFSFLNAGVRWSARQCALHFDEIDAWRATLSTEERARLNNPIDVWKTYNERDADGGPQRPKVRRRKKGDHAVASMLEYVAALEEQRDDLVATVEYLNGLIRELGGDPHRRHAPANPGAAEPARTPPEPMFD